MRIGGLEIIGQAALAPMAGVADRAVRTLARRYGAAYAVGEMASAKGIAMGSDKSAALLRRDDARPHGVQLFGADPARMAEAARAAEGFGPDFIDLNMGCPAPKVTATGAGSALLRDLPLAESVVKAVVGAARCPVTVKFRKGYGAEEDVAVEAARRFEAAGAAALTVHGRTRAQMYAPPVDLDCIAAVKRAVSIPVVGNGDIFAPADAKAMLERTGCDLVMVGRGALGAPWLFAQIEGLLARGEAIPPPPVAGRLAVMREEIDLLVADKGEFVGLREARKHVAWYMTGLRGAAQLRRACGEIASMEDVGKIEQMALALNREG